LRSVGEEVPGGAACVSDGVAAIEDSDRELVGSRVLPDVLDGVLPGRARRQGRQKEVIGRCQSFAAMPAGTLGHQKRMQHPGAIVQAISARCAHRRAVSAKGSTRPAATPRPGQTAPDRHTD
jgi:hypothetical protein